MIDKINVWKYFINDDTIIYGVSNISNYFKFEYKSYEELSSSGFAVGTFFYIKDKEEQVIFELKNEILTPKDIVGYENARQWFEKNTDFGK